MVLCLCDPPLKCCLIAPPLTVMPRLLYQIFSFAQYESSTLQETSRTSYSLELPHLHPQSVTTQTIKAFGHTDHVHLSKPKRAHWPQIKLPQKLPENSDSIGMQRTARN